MTSPHSPWYLGGPSQYTWAVQDISGVLVPFWCYYYLLPCAPGSLVWEFHGQDIRFSRAWSPVIDFMESYRICETLMIRILLTCHMRLWLTVIKCKWENIHVSMSTSPGEHGSFAPNCFLCLMLSLIPHYDQSTYITLKTLCSAIRRNKTGSFVEMCMHLVSVIPSEISQREKNKYILMHIYVESRKIVQTILFAKQK